MAGLVRLHRAHPELGEADASFSLALREELRERRSDRTLSIVELFACGVRLAFQDWVDAGEPDLEFVADRVTAFVNGPVRCAYDALLELPEPDQCESPVLLSGSRNVLCVISDEPGGDR